MQLRAGIVEKACRLLDQTRRREGAELDTGTACRVERLAEHHVVAVVMEQGYSRKGLANISIFKEMEEKL